MKLWCKEILTVDLFMFNNSGFHTPTKKKTIQIGNASEEGTQEFFCDGETDHKIAEVNCKTFYILHEMLLGSLN